MRRKTSGRPAAPDRMRGLAVLPLALPVTLMLVLMMGADHWPSKFRRDRSGLGGAGRVDCNRTRDLGDERPRDRRSARAGKTSGVMCLVAALPVWPVWPMDVLPSATEPCSARRGPYRWRWSGPGFRNDGTVGSLTTGHG